MASRRAAGEKTSPENLGRKPQASLSRAQQKILEVRTEKDFWALIYRLPGIEKEIRGNLGKQSGCAIWCGPRNAGGYGILRASEEIGGNGLERISLAHRVAYFLINKERVPAGLVLDHTCNVRPCVVHTEAVTQSTNVKRVALRKKGLI